MCAEWAIESAEQQAEWSVRVAATKRILYSMDYKNAINRSGKEILGIRSFLYRIRSAEIVLLYRKLKRMKQRYLNIARRKIHSLAVRLCLSKREYEKNEDN